MGHKLYLFLTYKYCTRETFGVNARMLFERAREVLVLQFGSKINDRVHQSAVCTFKYTRTFCVYMKS